MLATELGPQLVDLFDDLPFDLEDSTKNRIAAGMCQKHLNTLLKTFGAVFRDTTLVITTGNLLKIADLAGMLAEHYPLRHVAPSNQREQWLDNLRSMISHYELLAAEAMLQLHPDLSKSLDVLVVTNRHRAEAAHALFLQDMRVQLLQRSGHETRKTRKLEASIMEIIDHLGRVSASMPWYRLICEQ